MALCRNGRLFGKKTSLLFMFILTSTFFVAELVVGYLTNSTALVADSFHMLSDVLSIIIGYLAVVYSTKNSASNTYGWARAEVLGALCNAVFLLALCFSIIISALQRLIEIEKIKDPLLILFVGSAGLAINILGLIMFHGHSHNHGEHNHHHHRNEVSSDVNSNKTKVIKRGSQMNMKGVFLHVLGDALGSIVVIISAVIIYFVEGDWKYYVDPAMSLVIAGIIILTTLPLLKKSGLILLQNPPAHIKKDELLNKLKMVDGILAIHELHIWQLSGSCVIASAHLSMHRRDNFNETAMQVSKIFHDKGVHSLTLQPEFYDCTEARSICGTKTCYFLTGKPDSHQPKDDVDFGRRLSSITDVKDREDIEEIRLRENSVTDPMDEMQETPCLLSCVSTECKEYQCCPGMRKKILSRKVSEGTENDAFDDPNKV